MSGNPGLAGEPKGRASNASAGRGGRKARWDSDRGERARHRPALHPRPVAVTYRPERERPGNLKNPVVGREPRRADGLAGKPGSAGPLALRTPGPEVDAPRTGSA